ncbi:family 20 glycosylhydrolase [Psychrobacillus antarcticus]|uniref:family 20 glycosylhydrolase n=1 Tax=Psychrobacillus antarcticus TaxID=2879115 RepID=UPI002407A378|nr:family 20 glycosylhydrolase [Psychrobacillus antarcticus]
MNCIPAIKWKEKKDVHSRFKDFNLITTPSIRGELICKLSQFTLDSSSSNQLKLELLETIANSSEEFSIKVENQSIKIESPSLIGLQHGLSSLKILLFTGQNKINHGEIYEFPQFKNRGLFLDVSRGKMPTIEYLKNLISLISDLKYNILQLYFEDKFFLSTDPTIGQLTGSYSEREIRDLDAWCKLNKIDLQPCFQTYSHMHGILMLPEYHHLAENENLFSLAAGNEKVYEFIDRVFSQTLKWFSSTSLNINMDEAYDIGTGYSKDAVAEKGKGQVYFEHIEAVAAIARKYGVQKIIIWGDIALRYKELLQNLPEDIIVSDWNYNPLTKFPSLDILENSQINYWAAGGVSSWNSLFPRVYNTYINLINYSSEAKRQGAQGFLVTDWGDYGHFQPLGLSLYGYVIGAQQSYHPQIIEPKLIEDQSWSLLFPDEKIAIAFRLLMDSNLAPNVQTDFKSMSIYYFFDDLFDGLAMNGNERYPYLTHESFTILYENGSQAELLLDQVISDFEEIELNYPDDAWKELFGIKFIKELRFSAIITKFTGNKGLLSMKIKNKFALGNVTGEEILEYIIDVKKIYSEFLAIRKEFEEVWTFRANWKGIESSLLIFDKASIQLGEAVHWLSDQYRSVQVGNELDTKFKTYLVGKKYKILWTADFRNMWERAYPWQ